MASLSLSRRKFKAASLSTAMGVAALEISIKFPQQALAEHDAQIADPDMILATIDQIAPDGVVQDRVKGPDADLFAQVPFGYAHSQYSMLTGGSSLLSSANQSIQHSLSSKDRARNNCKAHRAY